MIIKKINSSSNIITFVKQNHYKTGAYRIAESYTVNSQLILVENIKETNQYDAMVGIFVGFLPRELEQNKSVKHKYYLYCSPFGQMDLSSYGFYSDEFKILTELMYFIKGGIICNAVTPSESLAERMGFIYTFPCMVNLELKIESNEQFFTLERKNYGFLGNNLRKHRNVVNQIAAISQLNPKEKIIVKDKDHYIHYAEVFNCEFEDRLLESDISYFEEISTHRLGFLCSWSEAFSYQALEYAMVGVPVIHGPCIDWYPDFDGWESTKVENIDCVDEIVMVAQGWLNDENIYKDFSEDLKDWFYEFNEEQKKRLFNVLVEICDNPKRNGM